MSDSMTKYLEKEFGEFEVTVKCGHIRKPIACHWCNLNANGITCRDEHIGECKNYAVIDGSLRLAELRNHMEHI